MKPGEGTTYHAIAQLDEVGGRFAVLGKPVVVGASAAPAPVAGGQRDVVPDEPPLGLDNPALEPSAVLDHSPAEQTGEPASRDRVRSPVPLADLERVDVGSPPLPPFRRS
jgi:hypothetical protein